MAGLIRSLFKGKKGRKDQKDETTANEEDYLVFQSCSTSKRQPQARFADDCMLPATAAYHTKGAPRLRKGPQSCPGGPRNDAYDFQKRKQRDHHEDFRIDDYPAGRRLHQSHRDLSHHHSLRQKEAKKRNSVFDFRSDYRSDDENDENDERRTEKKSDHYSMQNYENSERHRREERRKQERWEEEKNSFQHAMANMAYCMESVKKMEQLKKERDQFKKEIDQYKKEANQNKKAANRYKTRCEELENKFEQMEIMSPNYAGFQGFPIPMQPSPYHTPQFPPPQFAQPLSFQYPMGSSNQTFAQPPMMQNTSGPALARSVDFLNHQGVMQPPQFKYPQYSRAISKNPQGGSTTYTTSATSTTIGSEGAGESLVNPSELSFDFNIGAARNYDDSCDEDEVKDYRNQNLFPPSRMSDLTQSTARTN